MKNKIVTLPELIMICHEIRKEGKEIVATSGCFDILHAGHVTYLEEARQKGDVLVLLLNSDSSVRELKGVQRPIIPEQERAIVVAGLSCVDYVCLFYEKTPCEAIAGFRPDIWIKGADYAGKPIPEMQTIEEYGGRIEFVDLVRGCSSSNIVKKIKRML